MIRAALCFIVQDGNVLLVRKFSGFGKDRWNCPGGRLKVGEDPVDCTIRETFNHTGILLFDTMHRGRLYFYFGKGNNEPDWLVDILLATDWEGQPKSCTESRSEWFPLTRMPLDDMWQSDRHWLPPFLAGKRFEARFFFDDMKALLNHNITELCE